MKQRFENYLKYSTSQEEQTDEIVKDIDSIERNVVSDTAKNNILETQEQKQELVAELRSWRTKFFGESTDTTIESELGNRKLFKDEEGYHTYLKGGVKIPLTEGQIDSAKEWGTFWQFDDSIDKHTQQKVMSSQIRDMIAKKYDTQLITFGEHSKLNDHRKQDTYTRISERSEQLDGMSDGILAEKMMVSLLTKAQKDYHLPFVLHKVDIYEDVENKIDFIVSLETHDRGVRVAEEGSDVGIQFTLNDNKTELKQDQIDKSKIRGDAEIDDIILVTMPFVKIRDAFNKWRYDENGNRINEKKLDPRGPDHLMSEDEQVEIFKTLFNSLPIGISEDQLRLHIRES